MEESLFATRGDELLSSAYNTRVISGRPVLPVLSDEKERRKNWPQRRRSHV
jgi:hypothetical protein